MSPVAESRELAFARIVLARKLTTKDHAEECVKIARDLAKRGKHLAIEDIFQRKGYLRRPEIQAVLRALESKNPDGKKPEKALELAPNVGATPHMEDTRKKCPNCDKDPGHAFDFCPRCGADLETGGPGPQATICGSCSRVVKKDAAVCPRCASPLTRGRGQRARDGGWLDRAVFLLAAAACFYVLVYRHVIAPAPLEEAAAPAEDATPADVVQQALARGDLDGAARALEEAARAPGHDPNLDFAYVIACRKAGKTEAARTAAFKLVSEHPKDQKAALLLAQCVLDAHDADGAARVLDQVPDAARDDDYLRVSLRLADSRGDEKSAFALLEKIQARTPAETRRLAEAALGRGNAALDAENLEVARKEFEAAIALAPTYAPARQRLGILYLKQRRFGEARAQFERALESGDPAPALGLAMVLDQSGDKAGAIKAYRAFLEKVAKDARFAKEAATVAARIKALGGS
jgi:tetratricopeptide (TPR) repeat protein